MKKKDLKSGMIVMTNDGFFYLVLLDTGENKSAVHDENVLVGISANGNIIKERWLDLSASSDDLECKDETFTISEVFSTRYAANIGYIKLYKSIWKRELSK